MAISLPNIGTSQPSGQKPRQTAKKEKTPERFEDKLALFRDGIRSGSITAKAKPDTPVKSAGNEQTLLPNKLLFTAWDDSLSPEEQLEKLDSHLKQIADFSFTSAVGVEETLEHLASQYSVFKKQLSSVGASEHVEALEQIMQKNVDRYAKGFSKQVGGFFEKNGMPGEEKRMYQAIGERVKLLSDGYDAFLSTHSTQFNDLVTQSGEKSTCLSLELRRLYKAAGDEETGGINVAYTKRQLSSAAELAGVAQKILTGDFGAVSEEELGVRLGEIAVKGLHALEQSRAPLQFKDVFQTAIRSHIDSEIEKSAQTLKTKADSVSKKAFPPYDRTVIDSIIQSMTDSYEHTKSVEKTVSRGKEFGMHLFYARKDTQSEVERYRKSDFFEEKRADMLRANGGDLSQIRRASLASLADYRRRPLAHQEKTTLNLHA